MRNYGDTFKTSTSGSGEVRAYLSNRTHGQKVYVFGLQQIVAGAKPGEQDLVGWRYLTDIAPDLALEGDVELNREEQTLSFVGLSYGHQAAKAVRATKKVDVVEVNPNVDYQLYVLSIPGLLIDSFWLSSSNKVNDLVVPYDTSAKRLVEGDEELVEGHTYPIDRFLDIIRPLAQKRLDDFARLDDLGQGGPPLGLLQSGAPPPGPSSGGKTAQS